MAYLGKHRTLRRLQRHPILLLGALSTALLLTGAAVAAENIIDSSPPLQAIHRETPVGAGDGPSLTTTSDAAAADQTGIQQSPVTSQGTSSGPAGTAPRTSSAAGRSSSTRHTAATTSPTAAPPSSSTGPTTVPTPPSSSSSSSSSPTSTTPTSTTPSSSSSTSASSSASSSSSSSSGGTVGGNGLSPAGPASSPGN